VLAAEVHLLEAVGERVLGRRKAALRRRQKPGAPGVPGGDTAAYSAAPPPRACRISRRG
jgi:hypothetical protein